MTETEFTYSLPRTTECEACGRELDEVAWQLGRYGPREWFAIGIVKCEVCSIVRVAAAGSDDLAHSYARSTRLKFLKAVGQVH